MARGVDPDRLGIACQVGLSEPDSGGDQHLTWRRREPGLLATCGNEPGMAPLQHPEQGWPGLLPLEDELWPRACGAPRAALHRIPFRGYGGASCPRRAPALSNAKS